MGSRKLSSQDRDDFMKEHLVISCLAAFLSALALAGCSTTNATYKDAPFNFVESVGISQAGGPVPLIGFDISWVDATTHTYYLAAAQYAGIITIDLNTFTNPSGPTASYLGTRAFAGNISDPFNVDPNHPYEGGPNGVLVVGGTEVWAADGSPYTYSTSGGVTTYSNDVCNSSVKVINLNSKAVTPIYTNGCFRADELAYDSTDNLVLVGNPEEDPTMVVNPNATNGKNTPTAPFISLISTTTKKLVAQIAFDGTNGSPNAVGGIEQPTYSSKTGNFYVAVPLDGPTDPGNGAIAVISPTTLKVVNKFPLTNCVPNGMAIGPDGQEAFLACNSTTGPQLISLVNGSKIASFPNSVPAPTDSASLAIYPFAGNMCDQAWFNPTLNQYYAACQFAYNNSLVTVVDAGSGLTGATFLQNILVNPQGITSAGAAHSVASDPTTGALIVPLPMGAPWCPSPANPGCIGIWAPQGSEVAKPW